MPPAIKRRLLRLARSALFIYLGVILVLSLLQEWMIFPGHSTQGSPDAKVEARGNQELVKLTTKTGQTIHALWTPANVSDPSTAPTVLFFYGNAMTVADSGDLVRLFRQLNCNVLVPEYVGYGMSTGKPSEAELYATADAAYDYLLTRPGVTSSKVIVAGWSLGAAVATDLASRRPCRALLTFCAFTSTADMAKKLVPVFPAKLMLRHRFDNLAKFPTIKVPIFCAHGRRDSIIPVDMTARLARAAGVTPVIVDDADHNDFFDTAGTDLTDHVRAFLAQIKDEQSATETQRHRDTENTERKSRGTTDERR